MSSLTGDVSSPRAHRLFGIVACTFLVLVPTTAFADEGDKAMAQSLFDAGRALLEQKAFAEACAKFEESNRLDPSAGTLLNLGQCQEAQQKSASAWASYKQAITVGRAQGVPRKVDAANEFLAALEPKLSFLTISVEGATPGLTIRRNGVAIAEAARGTPLAIDPGPYTIEASAEGYASYSERVTIGPAEKKSFVVPKLVKLPEKPVVAPPPTSPTSFPDGLFVGGVVTGGIGLVGIAIGTAFGIATLENASQIEADECPNKACTTEGLALVEQARDISIVSTVSLAVGGAALIAGGVMIGISLGRDNEIAFVPWGPGGPGAVIGGTF